MMEWLPNLTLAWRYHKGDDVPQPDTYDKGKYEGTN